MYQSTCVHLQSEIRPTAVISVIYKFQREMKSFCAVCILMILTHDLTHFSFGAMALRCNLCVSKGFKNPCTPSVQICRPHITNCGHLIFKPDLLGYPVIRSCMALETCWDYIDAEAVTAKCCKTDLCN